MQELLTFANTASPIAILGVITIGLVWVIYKLSNGENFLSKISKTQDSKYPEMEDHFLKIQEHLNEIDFAYAEQKKFRENHSMHEIPEIRDSINRIEGKVDKMADAQINQGLDIARLKALSEK